MAVFLSEIRKNLNADFIIDSIISLKYRTPGNMSSGKTAFSEKCGIKMADFF